MTLGELATALRRSWIVLTIGFILTGALSAAAYSQTKPTFEITATFLFLPPASTVEPTSNPYLQLGGLVQTVDLVAVALSDQHTTTEMTAISEDVEYSVAADSQSSSPILVITVSDSSTSEAEHIRDLLATRVPERLDLMQRELGVGQENRVTTMLVTSDARVEEKGRDRLRMGLLVGLSGSAGTLAIAALWDARRTRARSATQSHHSVEAKEDDDV